MLFDEELIQVDQALGLAGADRLHAPVVEDVLEHAVPRQRRVVDVGYGMLVVEPLEERAQQRRLAGADLAGEDDEALALADAVDELGQRFAVARRLEEELRIRRGTEWCLAEPVELEVHDIYLPAAGRSLGVSSATRASLL